MHAAFPFVLFGGIALFVILGVLSMLSRGNLYDQIGQGGLTLGDTGARSGTGAGGAGASGAGAEDALDFDAAVASGSTAQSEREEEIRQMLQARSDRRVRRGESPLDIEAELARIEGASRGGARLGATESHDSGLTLEVRQLVQARNERRRRKGQPALDVEAEVKRTLAELGG